MMNKNYETPDELRFQRYINDWSLTGRAPEGMKTSQRSGFTLSPATYQAQTGDKSLKKYFQDRLANLRGILT